jgi:hypothetical protein
MKKYFLSAIIAGSLMSLNAGSGNENLLTDQDAIDNVSGAQKVELSSEEAMEALARISASLENYPLNYMLVFYQAEFDSKTQQYSLRDDIQDDNGEVVLSMSEPMYRNGEGSLYLASGQ